MVRVVASFCIALVALGLVVGIGESGGEKTTKVKGQLPPGWKKINLSAEQVQKIYSIQTAYNAKQMAIKEQLQKLEVEERKEMANILTEEQKKELAKILLGESK